MGKFAADKRARLNRAHEITEECEDRVEDIQCLEDAWTPANMQLMVDAREAMLERICRFAPELVKDGATDPMPGSACISTLLNIQKLHRKRLADDR